MVPTAAEIIHRGLLSGLERWEKVIAFEVPPSEIAGDEDRRGIRIYTPDGGVVLVETYTQEPPL